MEVRLRPDLHVALPARALADTHAIHMTGDSLLKMKAVDPAVIPSRLYHPHDPALPPALEKNPRYTLSALTKKVALKAKDPSYAYQYGLQSVGQKKVFDGLFKQMGDAQRPDGQLALQELLTSGRLTIGSHENPGRNLYDALDKLNRQPMADGLSTPLQRNTLMAELLQELADPFAVSQEHKGTCAATSRGQILWSMKDPAGYTDFLSQLASPRGKAKLPNGQVVQRPVDWNAGNDRGPSRAMKPGESRNLGRTLSSKLVEPVFMQVGIGDKVRYSNSFDTQVDPKNPARQVGYGGLWDEESARLLGSVFAGTQWAPIYPTKQALASSYQAVPKGEWKGPRYVKSKEKMIDFLKGNASVDDPVPASVNYELDGGHAILVTRVSTKKVGKEEVPDRVEYINPWGIKESQSVDGFKKVLMGITVQDGLVGQKG